MHAQNISRVQKRKNKDLIVVQEEKQEDNQIVNIVTKPKKKVEPKPKKVIRGVNPAD